MKNMTLTNNLGKIFLSISLFLLGVQQGYGQERAEKISTIIDSLRIVETQKMTLKDFQIEPLKYEASGADSLKLIEIENLLTDQEIRKRITQAFDEMLADSEINDLYNFTMSSVFNKVYSGLLFNNINSQFKDINSELERIVNNLEKADKDFFKFEPIPVERIDGFYATINYDPNRDTDITLEEIPAITKKDILEVKKGADNSSIDITLTKEGAKKFYLLTKKNIGKPIAIVIDKYIVSLPKVHSEISGGKVSIGGNFTEKEVENMIRQLKNE